MIKNVFVADHVKKENRIGVTNVMKIYQMLKHGKKE